MAGPRATPAPLRSAPGRRAYTEPGLVPPEVLGRTPGVYDFVINRLAERGVEFTITDEVL